MPEDENEQQQTEQPAEGVEETQDGEQVEETGTESEQVEETEQEGEDGNESEDLDELPEWARKSLSKANAEAANYRTKLREAEEKLKNAKTPEEVEAIVKGLADDREKSERALLIENVALKFKLSEKVQKRLKGSTREELEADAKELAELFGTVDEDGEIVLEGGLTPRQIDSEPSDPRSLARKYGRGSSRR